MLPNRTKRQGTIEIVLFIHMHCNYQEGAA